MKKFFLLIVALIVANNAFSQYAKWGIKAGGNLSSMSDLVERYPRDGDGYHITQKDGSGEFLGFHVGVFANLKMEKHIGFQPELLFSLQGGKHKRNVGDGGPWWQHLIFKFSYVQLPLLFEIKPVANLGILVGPQFGWNVSRKVTVTDFNYPDESATFSGSDFDDEIFNGGLKKHDNAMVFGLQYTIKRVTIGTRYNLGLEDNHDRPTGYGSTTKGWRSDVIQAGLGFSF